MPSISFKFRSRTQSQILDLTNVPSASAAGIRGRDAREKIAEAVGTPFDEIEIYFGQEKIHDEEMIPYFSCVDVERNAQMRRAGAVPNRGGMKNEGGVVISASGVAYRVGRGGAMISTNSGRHASGPEGGTGDEDPEMAMLRGLQQRMGEGVESVAVETRRGGGGRGRGGGGGGTTGDGAGGGANSGPPPPGYVCHNCGNKGHFIEDCPVPRGQRGVKLIAPPTGIAESMLVPCAPDDPARCVTRDGRFVKRIIASDMFIEVAAPVGADDIGNQLESSGTALSAEAADALRKLIGAGASISTEAASTNAILEEANLLCFQCKKLLNKAVQLPCASSSTKCNVRFCSLGDCLDLYIASKDEEAICPKCEEIFGLDELEEIPEVREQVENVRQFLKKRPRE